MGLGWQCTIHHLQMICPFKYPLTMDFPATSVFPGHGTPGMLRLYLILCLDPDGTLAVQHCGWTCHFWIRWLNHGLRWICPKSCDIFIHVAGGFRSFFAYFILGVIWWSLDLTDIEHDEYDAPACGKVIWFRFQLLILWGYQPQNSFPKVSAKNQVVYYMQIKDQLPSLHRLMEWSQKDYQILNDYAWNFVSLEDAKQAARNGSRRYEGGRPWEVSISWASKVGFGLTFSTSVKYCRWYVLRDCFVSLQCHGPLIHYLFYSVSLHSRWCWLFLEGTTHSIVNETCDHSYASSLPPLILCAHISSYVQYYIILIYFPWQTLPILCILLANLPIHVPNGLGKPWYTYQQHHDLALPHLAPQMWHINSAHMNSAELLRGFFSFYATDFVWGSEALRWMKGWMKWKDVERRLQNSLFLASNSSNLGWFCIEYWVASPWNGRKCMIKNHAENRIAAGMSWAYKLQSRRRLYISQPW